MSLYLFGERELGNLAYVVGVDVEDADGECQFTRILDSLERMSRHNAGAFNATYKNNQVKHHTARDIKLAGSEIDRNPFEAWRTLQSIRFNLIANDGQDFATKEDLDALAWMLGTVANSIFDRLGCDISKRKPVLQRALH